MGDIKSKVQGIDANVQARDMDALVAKTGNVYESLVAIAKRARQINYELKTELHQKLEEFATNSEAIEEIHENKEQIEISKFYEKLPNSAIIGYDEFMSDQLTYSYPQLQQASLEQDKTEEDSQS